MKNIKYYLLFLAIGFSVACNRADDGDLDFDTLEKPILSDATTYDAKIKSIYENYNLYLDYRITQEDLEYNWVDKFNWSSSDISWEYEAPDMDYVLPVASFYEEKVLQVIPRELTLHHAKHRVGLVGRFHKPIPEDEDDENSPIALDVEINGWTSYGYLALGLVGPQFDTYDKEELQRSWISLTIEGMMDAMPYPGDFYAVSADVYDTYVPMLDDIAEFNENGILKMHRAGPVGDWFGMGYYYNSFSQAQDFGDYVAYILLADKAEKDATRALSSAGLIEKKEQLVQEYFKRNFGFELSDPAK